IDPVRDGYSSDRAANLFDNLRDRLKTVPGVRQVVVSQAVPFSPQIGAWTFTAAGDANQPDKVVSSIAKNVIGANFFAAIDVTMLEGREFDVREERLDPAKTPDKSVALPVVINETAARELFGAADPLGRRFSETGKSYSV